MPQRARGATGRSRGSWKVKVPRANPFGFGDRRALHWFDAMLRSFDHGLFQQARHLTAVGTLQDKVPIVVAGSQLVLVAKQASG